MNKVPCEPMVGADPEWFVRELRGQLNVVPCVGILPGTKKKPYAEPGWSDGFSIQEDCVVAEATIPPAKSPEEFYDNISFIRSAIDFRLRKLDTPLLTMSTVSTHDFDRKQLVELGKQANTFGCEPDHDAYTGGKMRRLPAPPATERYAGGHIHLGGNFQCPDFVAALFCDWIFGLYHRFDWSGFGDITGRTKVYGRPGLFRPKPYGIEYRTLTNGWTSDEYGIQDVFYWGHKIATWLSETDAQSIQNVFRAIPWVRVRDVFYKSQLEGLSSEVINEADKLVRIGSDAGMPI